MQHKHTKKRTETEPDVWMQMMWMGSGIAPPVMFPGMHQYLPQMGPSMPRMAPAFMAAPQPVVPSAPQGHATSPGYHHHHHHHMPGAVSLPEHYAHFLGVNHQVRAMHACSRHCACARASPCFTVTISQFTGRAVLSLSFFTR